jgi:amino acid permease
VPLTWGDFGIEMTIAVHPFSGFEATAIYRAENSDPDRTISRATILVVLFIGFFYGFSSWALITALGVFRAAYLSVADSANAHFDVARHFCRRLFYTIRRYCY